MSLISVNDLLLSMDKHDVYQILDTLNSRYAEMSADQLSETCNNYQMKNLIWLLWNYFRAETGNLPREPDQ